MVINTGEYVHIIHRQLFREDAQRHFVGTVESHEGTIMRVKGYYQTVDLSTTYLGIKLRTPPVPSASPLSEEIDKIKQMEQADASAVVLHLLFEEQMEIDPCCIQAGISRCARSLSEAHRGSQELRQNSHYRF